MIPIRSVFAAVIPAYNERYSIVDVIEGTKLYAFPIVIDDGSSDITAQLASQSGALVVSHQSNMGYDATLQTGLFKAIELGYTFAITIDADRQHDPATLELFKMELLKGADLVVGVRDRKQRFSESLFGHITELIWSVSDPLCGMKGYRLSHLKRAGYFDSYKSIGTEYLLRCLRSGLKVSSVPVLTQDRFHLSRFGHGLKPNFLILRAMLLGFIKAKRF